MAITRRLMCLFGWLGLGLFAQESDPRLEKLSQFFKGLPARHHSLDMLAAADKHNLDWRLLPAICFVETTGGKFVFRANNWFGWNSGRTSFRSVPAAIEHVAKTLAEGSIYRGKSLWQKLHLYNSARQYPYKVLRAMSTIASTV